jgi:hypothetical protein
MDDAMADDAMTTQRRLNAVTCIIDVATCSQATDKFNGNGRAPKVFGKFRQQSFDVPSPGLTQSLDKGTFRVVALRENISDSLKLSIIQIYTDHRLNHNVFQLIRDCYKQTYHTY